MSGGKSGSGHRGLKERVKTARRRKPSSQRWLQRQLNDPYVARTKAEGWRSRAAFKLAEINEKYNLLKPGSRVVDLGAAPGGWSQVAARLTGSTDASPLIIAIDYLGVDPLPGVVILQKDFLDDDAPQILMDHLGGQKADLVLSDMAAPTTGHKATDHLRIMGLCETAAEFARDVLAPGGHFLAKVFRGGTEHDLLLGLKRDFERVHHVKPPASRSDSRQKCTCWRWVIGAVEIIPKVLDNGPPEAAISRPLAALWPTCVQQDRGVDHAWPEDLNKRSEGSLSRTFGIISEQQWFASFQSLIRVLVKRAKPEIDSGITGYDGFR